MWLRKKEGSLMPRKGSVSKRDVLPDPLYNSKLISKLINTVMYDGKKGVAQKIVYDAFEIVNQKTGKEAVDAFNEALNNIMPVVEVKPRRVGGATYQVPVEVKEEIGLKWIVIAARKRHEKTMRERFAGEMLDAINNMGGAVKKKEDTHKMAEANKAFAQYRW